MQVSNKEDSPGRMLCCNCGALILNKREYCRDCAPLRSTIATATIEKCQAEEVAENAEQIIQTAVKRLTAIRDQQRRIRALSERSN